MNIAKMDRSKKLKLLGACILIVGIGAGLAVYLTAGSAKGPVSGYELSDSGAYPLSPFDSKQQMRSMELYGGKMGVMMYQFAIWFGGLWQGRNLARMIWILSAAAAWLCFRLARIEAPGGEVADKTG
ncbi:hypothetical protein [Fundidesulfovibrio agrisoli]|uniref:hypothetical protein n=1 Tax=Fundidesulfovibrio agrisoli TaxID=2922717 RepID=UPI001FABF7FC|nr:hypothetical protein [Fundidesulfovibrio agrisoli]